MNEFDVTYRVPQENLQDFLDLANELGKVRDVAVVEPVKQKPTRPQRPHMSSRAMLRVRASNGVGTLPASGKAALTRLRDNGPQQRNMLTKALAIELDMQPSSVSALLSNMAAEHWIEEVSREELRALKVVR